MSPIRTDNTAFGVRDVLGIKLRILGREIPVKVHRQDDGACLDRAKGCQVISTIHRVVADVALFPSPELRKEVVRVAFLKDLFPEIGNEFFVVMRAEVGEGGFAVEWIGPAPPGIDRRKGTQSTDGGRS